MSARTPLPPDTSVRRIAKRSRDSSTTSKPARGGTCKTCTYCRQKKVKCDGGRPNCNACVVNGRDCSYPQDGRRDARQPSAKVQNLEASLAALWGHMKAMGMLSSAASMSDMPDLPSLFGSSTQASPPAESNPHGSDSVMSVPVNRFLSPPQTHSPQVEGPVHWSNAVDQDRYIGHPPQDPEAFSPLHVSNKDTFVLQDVIQDSNDVTESEDTSLSPCEARVAGVVQIDGCSSVHGLCSILNPQLPRQKPNSRPKKPSDREAASAASKARLVSNAALQRQSESRLSRGPSNTLDLDGVAPELAKHLLDLHWNRQHYAYLLTYRPAIMDSLANGGPWANKLLLNAIYYSSCLYSDRQCLRPDPNDPQSSGMRFYDRFRDLLGNAIVQPSIPSAIALLLCGATLVSQGRASAGWTLCGAAYRMIIDMGIHLMLEPATAHQEMSSSRRLHLDIEQEMRKRLYWGAFVTDATQSLYLGRPPALDVAEARIPQLLLDTYEELEDWSPYKDPVTPSPADQLHPTYLPSPAYAVTTFNAMARLFEISSQMIREFYSLNTIKQATESLISGRERTIKQLENWKTSLPVHLQFNPDVDVAPPPHQITPHTTYHVLNIMLRRPFLEEGHLRRHSSRVEKDEIAKVCIDHAMSIRKLVDVYRKTFTLRRAPFLLSYAVYSAVIVILKRDAHEREMLREPVSFFWMTLSELQRGCNFGLKKPLAILREMMAEMTESQPHSQQDEPDVSMALMLDRFANNTIPRTSFSPWGQGSTPELIDPMLQDSGFVALDFLNDQERIISDDALYGLFAPPSNFF